MAEPTPIINAGIFAGHSTTDPGTQLKIPAGTDINGVKTTENMTINEADINVQMRDLAVASLSAELRSRGINPDAINVITDSNEKSTNLSLNDAIKLARTSDTVPLEIHQDMAGAKRDIASIIKHSTDAKGNVTPYSQEAYDFAANLHRYLDPVMEEGIRKTQFDGTMKNQSPEGVLNAPELKRGINTFGFTNTSNGRGVIFEGNVLQSAATYAHFLENKEQMGDAIAKAVADSVELELTKKITQNPALADDAYLPNHPSRQEAKQPDQVSTERSPEIKALHDKLGGFLYPTLEEANVSQKHADAMVATAVQESVAKNIGVNEVTHAGVDKDKNLISVFSDQEFKFACFDAVAASKNNPEQMLAEAQQQLEQPQQQQQLAQNQERERSGLAMS